MGLRLIIKKPPGVLKTHPSEIVRALIGAQLLVATNQELRTHDRSDLIDTAFAVDIDQIIALFDQLGENDLADYWRKYAEQRPNNNFLLFYDLDEEIELIY